VRAVWRKRFARWIPVAPGGTGSITDHVTLNKL